MAALRWSRVAASVAGLFLALLTAPALGATVTVSGSTLSYVAAAGEVNNLQIIRDDGSATFSVIDSGAPVTPGPGCVSVDAGRASCSATSVTAISVELGDQNDIAGVFGPAPAASLGGGSGDDALTGGPANDTVAGDAGGDVLAGGAAGQDTILGGDGGDQLDGGGDDDVLEGGAGGDLLDGNVGHDVIRGDGGDDELRGGLGYGGDESDVLHGGEGIDTATFAGYVTGAVNVTLDNLANDGLPGENDNVGPTGDVENLYGTNINTIFGDVLTGNSANNVIEGGFGYDVVDGGGGNDILVESGDFGIDSDSIHGGAGADAVDYSSRVRSVWVDLDGVADDGEATTEGDNVEPDVEDVVGGSAGDRLTGDADANRLAGGAGGDILDGGAGADLLDGGDGIDTASYATHLAAVVVDLGDAGPDGGPEDDGGDDLLGVEDLAGGAGDDVLVGDSGDNVVAAGDGDDLVDGAAGADELSGGPGDDLADYSDRTLVVTADLDGSPGDDGVSGEGDTLAADLEGLLGGAAADHLDGNEGDNFLVGGPGNDRLDGRGRDDVLDGGSGADTLIGGSGFDLADYVDRVAPVFVDLDGASGDDGEAGEGDTVATDVEDLRGGAGADTLIGSDNENFLFGMAGNDTLDGQGGPDLLVGHSGDDHIASRDGISDEDSCGSGHDAVVGDWIDSFVDCEQVARPTATVSTGPAREVGQTTAKVSASVNPNGGPTTVYAELGTTPSYGTKSASIDVGDGDSPVVVEAQFSGLAPGGTYHYRFVGANPAGVVTGEDRTFTTVAIPVQPLPSPRPRAVRCVVPKLKGKTLARARRDLRKAHCSLGKVRRKPSQHVRRGRVLAQSPAPKSRRKAGARVNVLISAGPRRRR